MANAEVVARRWKRDRQIFCLSCEGVDYYPGYALNPAARYRPYLALMAVLEVFGAASTHWQLALWFESPNSYLNGCSPKDILSTDPAQVLAAASREAQGVQHG